MYLSRLSIQMPSAMNGNRTVQSASPDGGSAPGQITLGGGQTSGAQTEAMKQVLGVVDKKVRNMEKKKGKLDDYQSKKNKGERLNRDQLDALTKYQEVTNNLEFARELQKSFLSLGQDIQKAVKKAARQEQLQREESEQKRLKTILELQFLLDRLGEDSVRQELRQGAASVDTPSLLSDTELTALDELYKLVGPEPDQNTRFTDQYEEASQHLMDLLEGKDKAVAGTTYKALKDSLDRVLLSGYFDQAQSHQNGVCEETEEQTEEQAVSTILQQPVQSAPPPITTEAHPLNRATPPGTPPADPVVRKQEVQNLLSQMQGPYNFMQPIDPAIISAQPIDPAIISAQPMKPQPQNMDLPQMGCPPVHPESFLSPHTVPVQPESTQVPMVSPTPEVYSTPPPMYRSSHTAEPRSQTDSIDTIQVSLSSEQPPASSQTQQVFQPVSGPRPPHSSGINVNAAPFQSMQTVFNLNAPVPPANETEALTEASQYQNSYSQQGFSSQSQQLPVEQTEVQTEVQTEQLQSGVGAFHSQDLSLPSQDLSQGQQLSQQGPGFGPGASRQAQSFYNSRGMTRGGPRNARGLTNGYRGPHSVRYDSYRSPFTNTPNSGYQQAQFNTPRDYSNGGNYQRGEGYNQNYKRGAGQGPRGVSRGGNAQVMRS
uniref:Caprin-1-like n=1 Tax=Salmo trutta TaxID=8032 RepID=A0A674E538_SALTR